MKNRIDKSEKNEYIEDVASFIKSFTYAFSGLFYAVKNERNMRVHICAAFFVLEFAFVYKLSAIEYIALILTISTVMAAELINTAIEATVNLETKSYNKLAKIAKDVAAGAVLLTAICAVLVAVFMFSDTEKLINVYNFICSHLWIIGVLAVEIIIAVFFVFGINKRKKQF